MATKESVSDTFKSGIIPGAYKQQCWEFMDCGQEKEKACMSYIRMAGRRCWLVSGSLGGNGSQCVALTSVGTCKSCEFYIGVKKGYV